MQALSVTVPRPLLTARLPQARHYVSRRIAGNSRLGALAGTLVRELYRLDDATEDAVACRLGASALDILATTLETELGAVEPCAEHQRRFAAVKRYILANLHDPELDLAKIVKTQAMAPRTLYRLFAGEGTTPMRWLWQQRLAASFKALAEGQIHPGHRRRAQLRLQRRLAFQPRLQGRLRPVAARLAAARLRLIAEPRLIVPACAGTTSYGGHRRLPG